MKSQTKAKKVTTTVALITKAIKEKNTLLASAPYRAKELRVNAKGELVVFKKRKVALRTKSKTEAVSKFNGI